MAKKLVLGTLTIGQAPRPDVTPILDRYIPAGVRRVHSGLLDGMTAPEIAARFGTERDGAVLVTRLLDGSSVQLASRKVLDAVQSKLSALETDGCDIILLLCTGTFHGLKLQRSWLVEPDLIIPPAVAALVQRRQLGIVVPVEAQIKSESGKWAPLQRAPIYEAASPYTDTIETLCRAGQNLKSRGAELLLLDCMGFTEDHRRPLAETSGLPVVLSNALAAKIVSELFEA